MSDDHDIRPRTARIDPEVADEFPGLGLHWARLPACHGRSPASLVMRLRELANGYRGAAVIAMRTKPVPAAYRNFYRQIGLDPDVARPPSEQAALDRLFHGTFRPQDRLSDALLVALLETGVPIWPLDAGRVEPDDLTIRPAGSGEQLGAEVQGRPIAPGTLVVGDSGTVHSILFEKPAAGSAPGPDSRELVLYSVSVAGVPAIHVEEAFWLAAEAAGADA